MAAVAGRTLSGRPKGQWYVYSPLTLRPATGAALHDIRTDEEMSTDNRARIAEYLSRFFPVQDLKADDDIFELGFVSSVFAMRLVSFVEHEFGITVENEDLELEYFCSIAALDAFVARKLSVPVPVAG